MSKAGAVPFASSRRIHFTATGAIAVSVPFLSGGMWHIPLSAATEAGQVISCDLGGAFYLAKASGTAIGQGAPVWWDAANSRVSATPLPTPPLGRVREAAASSDTEVVVALNERVAIPIQHAVTSAEGTSNAAQLTSGLAAAPTAYNLQIISTATPSVPRLPDTVTLNANGTVQVNDTALATGEVIVGHLFA
ncbi:MAG: DUF2190 family protein [Planctomycetota bacterium]